MSRGNSPTDGGHLILERDEIPLLGLSAQDQQRFIKPFVGSRELIRGIKRYCIWIDDDHVGLALVAPKIKERIEAVRRFRLKSQKKTTVRAANWAHRFDERKLLPTKPVIVVPVISSENRPHLPCDVLPVGTVVSNKAFTLPIDPLWPFSIIVSRVNLVWVATVCARIRTDYSYTSTVGWNTLPVPRLSEKNKADLTASAENILLAREAHFPATIAELYEPETMPDNLRVAHERNDEVIERMYIGRRFRSDTERLEKLFELYIDMDEQRGAA